MKRLSVYLILMSAFLVVACGNDDKPTRSTQPTPVGKVSADDLPIISIEHARAYIFENEEPAFVVTRTGDAVNELEVNVSVSETGDMIAADDEGAQTVMFDANETMATIPLVIVSDTADEDHSTVTVEVTASAEYALALEHNSASVLVRDDDGTLIELSLDPLDQVVSEGGTAQFYLVATSVDDGTFTVVGDLARVFGGTSAYVSWSTDGSLGEAQSPADYPAISEQLSFAYADFEKCDRLVLRQALPPIPTVRDDDEEDDERFLVKLEIAPGLDERIGFVSGKTTVTVTISPIADGTLRLVDGASEREGRLEVFHNGQWGTICDDYWTDVEARVACRQLGFTGLEASFPEAGMGQGTGPIWMSNLWCHGPETRLDNCAFGDWEGRTWGYHNCCRHSEDVGLRCK